MGLGSQLAQKKGPGKERARAPVCGPQGGRAWGKGAHELLGQARPGPCPHRYNSCLRRTSLSNICLRNRPRAQRWQHTHRSQCQIPRESSLFNSGGAVFPRDHTGGPENGPRVRAERRFVGFGGTDPRALRRGGPGGRCGPSPDLEQPENSTHLGDPPGRATTHRGARALHQNHPLTSNYPSAVLTI